MWIILLALHDTSSLSRPEQPEIATYPASTPAHLFLTQHKSIEAFLADRARTNTHAPAPGENEPRDAGRPAPPRDSTSRIHAHSTTV